MSVFGNTATSNPFGSTMFASTQPSTATNTSNAFSFGKPATTNTSLTGGQTGQQQNIFGNTQTNTQNTGVFGQSTQNNTGGGIFGQSQAQNNTGGGMFGQSQAQNNTGGGMFGQSQAQNQQPAQQLPQLSQSMYTPVAQNDVSIPGQIQRIQNQWDTGHPDCAFRFYFYNKVDPNAAPYYRPTPREDPKAWETALSQKPGPGYIPVLCVGFAEMTERIKTQTNNLASFNQRLHEINNSLEAMLSKHDLVVSVRALDAKRRHTVLKQRAMQLASKVQMLRNRGYALGGDEEELKAKLQVLERGVLDPGLGARGEEIWARMVGVRERAKILKDEVARRADSTGSGIDEDTARRAEKILEDYGKQLNHLKRELALVSEDLKLWQADHPTSN